MRVSRALERGVKAGNHVINNGTEHGVDRAHALIALSHDGDGETSHEVGNLGCRNTRHYATPAYLEVVLNMKNPVLASTSTRTHTTTSSADASIFAERAPPTSIVVPTIA